LEIYINGKAKTSSHSFKALAYQLSMSFYFKISSICNCCLLSPFVALKLKTVYSSCAMIKSFCFIFVIFNSVITFSFYDTVP